MAEPNGPGTSQMEEGSLEPIAELTALAQVLQQGRLALGLSIAELAQRLHMGQEQLQALEQADRSRLPEPVFVIAQARRVAAALNVDAGNLIDALRACESYKSSTITLNPEALKPRPPKPQPSAAPREAADARAIWWVLPLGVVVAAAGWGLWSQRAALQALVASHTTQRPKPPSALPKAAAPKPAPVLPAVLRVRTANVSWMEITNLTGQQRLFRGMFRGEQSYPLGQGLRLRAGRPDQVQVALGNGPLKPLGTVKDIRWFRFQDPANPAPAAKAASKTAPRPAIKPALNAPLGASPEPQPAQAAPQP